MSAKKSYLNFVRDIGQEIGRTTCVWRVENVDTEFQLGTIRWQNGWRKYVFFPSPHTLFDAGCLDEITNFLRTHQDNRRSDDTIIGTPITYHMPPSDKTTPNP